MRIVIDMQGAQSESRFRGIGRYTMSFVKAILRNRGEHDIVLALNGLFPETIESIRTTFDGLLPQDNIRIWNAPAPVYECEPVNERRRETAEILREAFLASLNPDIIHITSLFEGYGDDAVTSIRRLDLNTPISVTLYDLIPLLNPEQYLNPNPRYEKHYRRKVKFLCQSSLCLAISDFSKNEIIQHLGFRSDDICTVYGGVKSYFCPNQFDLKIVNDLFQRFNIYRPFILYTGGCDIRKNLPRLIEAFSMLAPEIRDKHQLVFAGKMPTDDTSQLKNIAQSMGLREDELVFTNYISDEELVQFYNLCQIYVFPSWHEGLGLPALEAMACGAPVIGANASSLPEIIAFPDALFDPFDVTSITNKMTQVLQDREFRRELQEHGLKQSQKFAWGSTAKLAIQAWENLSHSSLKKADYLKSSLVNDHLINILADINKNTEDTELKSISHYLALNQQAGNERQLFVDISELSQNDAGTGVQRVVRSYLKWLLQSPPQGFRVEPIYGTLQDGYRYARCFTLKFLNQYDKDASDEPIRWQRGDIFLGLDMQHHVQIAHSAFYQKLYHEGVIIKFLVYDLLPIQLSNLFSTSNLKELHEQWLNMVSMTHGAICISKATADAFTDWINVQKIKLRSGFSLDWVHIGADIDNSQPSRGLPGNAVSVLDSLHERLTFLCVSTIEPRKQQQQILGAVELLWQNGLDINLVFVGRQGWKTEALAKRLRIHEEIGRRLFWLEGISDEYLEKVYAASTCLIAASLNEGFGLPLIEASRHNLPIVARDIPVFREVAGNYAYYFAGEDAEDLAQSLQCWLDLYKLQQHPSSIGMPWSTWQESTNNLKAVLISHNYPRQQLLVDISELVQFDAKTGIQRVVRNILKELLINSPENYRVEPVYARVDRGYYYAREFMQRFLGFSETHLVDEPIEYSPGDIFLGLDLQPQIQVSQKLFYQYLRRQGISVHFLVYDLLCLIMSQYFVKGSDVGFKQWLEVVLESDGAICISKSVAEELAGWSRQNQVRLSNTFKINWFHLGADISQAQPTTGFPVGAETTIHQLCSNPSFLMVGTLEPRKGHKQVLDAFEKLWESDVDASLVIVGKKGWLVDNLVKQLKTHPELNQRLFWLDGISDEYLERVYGASTCLIAASYGEGFGLPLIESAQYGLPIIARDIPVFREVAGEHAYYFNANTADELAKSVCDWLKLYHNHQHPKPDNLPWLTWQDSSQQLLQAIGLQKTFV